MTLYIVFIRPQFSSVAWTVARDFTTMAEAMAYADNLPQRGLAVCVRIVELPV